MEQARQSVAWDAQTEIARAFRATLSDMMDRDSTREEIALHDLYILCRDEDAAQLLRPFESRKILRHWNLLLPDGNVDPSVKELVLALGPNGIFLPACDSVANERN